MRTLSYTTRGTRAAGLFIARHILLACPPVWNAFKDIGNDPNSEDLAGDPDLDDVQFTQYDSDWACETPLAVVRIESDT